MNSVAHGSIAYAADKLAIQTNLSACDVVSGIKSVRIDLQFGSYGRSRRENSMFFQSA